MAEMLAPDKELPAGISGKHDIIFGNIQDIYNFHNKWVLYIFFFRTGPLSA